MRKTFITVLAVAALILSSCASAPEKLDSFVTDSEKNWKGWSDQDWADANAKFKELTDECDKNRKDFTQEEQDKVAEAKGRYRAIQIRGGVKDLSDILENSIKDFPGFVGGLSDGISALGDDFSDQVNEISNTVEQTFDDLSNGVDAAINDMDRKLNDFSNAVNGFINSIGE